jgi:hypothetical protein
MSSAVHKRFWLTFPGAPSIERPVMWEMSRQFPDVVFDIRQASVKDAVGIMAVLLSGSEAGVESAVAFLRSKGVIVEPIEKSVVEG